MQFFLFPQSRRQKHRRRIKEQEQECWIIKYLLNCLSFLELSSELSLFPKIVQTAAATMHRFSVFFFYYSTHPANYWISLLGQWKMEKSNRNSLVFQSINLGLCLPLLGHWTRSIFPAWIFIPPSLHPPPIPLGSFSSPVSRGKFIPSHMICIADENDETGFK